MIPVCTGWLTLFAFDDSESDVLDRIKFRGFNWSFAIQRLSERIDNTSKQVLCRPGVCRSRPVVLTSSPSLIVV